MAGFMRIFGNTSDEVAGWRFGSMRRFVSALGILAGLSSFTPEAKADHVVLAGGTTLEGKATRKGDKVIIEMESGTVTLPLDSVKRIDRGASAVSRFEERYAALPAGDARARLELADYCRDHDMHGRERQLLVEVLELEPNNAVARARLGYVKTDAGWVTQAEANRAKGLVERDGKWVSPAEARAMDREETAARESARRREEADEQLAQRKADLAAREAALRAEQDAERARAYYQSWWGAGTMYYPPVYGYGWPYARFGRGVDGDCASGGDCRRGYHPAPHLSPGPFSPSSMDVVKVPYRHPW
jgi:hypothetical protein